MKIPKFQLFGENDPRIEEEIQPCLEFRQLSDLGVDERKIVLRELSNHGWLDGYSTYILKAITYLNHEFLKQCPGKNLHKIKPVKNYRDSKLY